MWEAQSLSPADPWRVTGLPGLCSFFQMFWFPSPVYLTLTQTTGSHHQSGLGWALRTCISDFPVVLVLRVPSPCWLVKHCSSCLEEKQVTANDQEPGSFHGGGGGVQTWVGWVWWLTATTYSLWCLFPASALLASGFTVALSSLCTMRDLGQKTLSPQKRRLTNSLLWVDLGLCIWSHSEAWMCPVLYSLP
jgi:hypothetical protein